MPDQSLFDFAEPEDPLPIGTERRCTPELLLAYVHEHRAEHGRSPTLLDCKKRFGLLNTLVCGWELKREGLL